MRAVETWSTCLGAVDRGLDLPQTPPRRLAEPRPRPPRHDPPHPFPHPPTPAHTHHTRPAPPAHPRSTIIYIPSTTLAPNVVFVILLRTAAAERRGVHEMLVSTNCPRRHTLLQLILSWQLATNHSGAGLKLRPRVLLGSTSRGDALRRDGHLGSRDRAVEVRLDPGRDKVGRLGTEGLRLVVHLVQEALVGLAQATATFTTRTSQIFVVLSSATTFSPKRAVALGSVIGSSPPW